jgi:hypothetical protein
VPSMSKSTSFRFMILCALGDGPGDRPHVPGARPAFSWHFEQRSTPRK